MTAVREHFPRFTPEEYFAWEEQQLERHEYIDGEVYAMNGGTINHSEVALNFGSLLKSHLRGSGCKILNSNARVNILASSHYVYPDVSVTCHEQDRTATKFISHPCLIVEVLSPSTAAYDRGDKFTMYRRSPSLQEYMMIDANKIAIDIYHKNDSGRWEIINYRAGEMVELASIDLTFPIEQMFAGIIFTDEE